MAFTCYIFITCGQLIKQLSFISRQCKNSFSVFMLAVCESHIDDIVLNNKLLEH